MFPEIFELDFDGLPVADRLVERSLEARFFIERDGLKQPLSTGYLGIFLF
jgi:hypothetical protein